MARRERRDQIRCGTSAGTKPSAARISALPPSVEELEEKGQGRLPATNHPARPSSEATRPRRNRRRRVGEARAQNPRRSRCRRRANPDWNTCYQIRRRPPPRKPPRPDPKHTYSMSPSPPSKSKRRTAEDLALTYLHAMNEPARFPSPPAAGAAGGGWGNPRHAGGERWQMCLLPFSCRESKQRGYSSWWMEMGIQGEGRRKQGDDPSFCPVSLRPTSGPKNAKNRGCTTCQEILAEWSWKGFL